MKTHAFFTRYMLFHIFTGENIENTSVLVYGKTPTTILDKTYRIMLECHQYRPDVVSTVGYTLDKQQTLQHWVQRSDLGLRHDQSRAQAVRRGSFPG